MVDGVPDHVLERVADLLDDVLGVRAADEFADAVAADTAEARRLGVTGTPFFLIDGRYTHSGAQPAEVLGEALTRVLAETHPLTPLVDLGVGVGVVAPACGPAGCALD